MAEYIEREALLREIERRESFMVGDKTISVDALKRFLLNRPTADVAPVRHGQWEWFEEWYPSTPDHPMECEDYGWRCGECKTTLEDMVGGCWDDSYDEPKLNYCPNCGAKMDRGDSDEADRR